MEYGGRRPHTRDRPKKSCPEYDRYGLGIAELDCWIGHTGDYLGYQALVMFLPETNATVVILINLKDFTDPEHIPKVIFREYADILNANSNYWLVRPGVSVVGNPLSLR